jgi:diadenosine tetraphosphatase ApaH/serine/threonine PP2A family protein phosphatase
MQVVVLSDIHANLEALEAVLQDAGRWDALWFLGDIVGYGPDPMACIERLAAERPAYWLAGNHDLAALGAVDTEQFNPEAKRSAEWTAERLDDGARAALAALHAEATVAGLSTQLVHGSPRHPVWEYILNAVTAAENFPAATEPLCLFGHTHVPVAYEEGVDGALRVPMAAGSTLRLEAGARYLVNPGSVGQPRDGDPRASYARFDADARSIELRRVPYDIRATQAKILAAGLPERLAARLDFGW